MRANRHEPENADAVPERIRSGFARGETKRVSEQAFRHDQFIVGVTNDFFVGNRASQRQSHLGPKRRPHVMKDLAIFFVNSRICEAEMDISHYSFLNAADGCNGSVAAFESITDYPAAIDCGPIAQRCCRGNVEFE